MTNTTFIYEFKGKTVKWQVITPRGRGFLCEIIEGPDKGQQAEFATQTIRFGQFRLKQMAGEAVAAV